MQKLNGELKNQNGQEIHRQENLPLFEIIEFLSKNIFYVVRRRKQMVELIY